MEIKGRAMEKFIANQSPFDKVSLNQAYLVLTG